jgi:Tol biopolymer transport system component
VGGLNTFASWSPDRKKLAFQHRNPNKPRTYAVVYIMNADGANRTAISGEEAHIDFGGG